ncbi:MAG TPA: GNAT family N-acetyltransferase [Acidobacteriaceae bacterium]|jgi:GNAT superfamily N-acetyltransferase|nr:GNAT family N-acetyltransferase [Acidobacteriaceae bacterium]
MTPTLTLLDKPDGAAAQAIYAPLLAFNNENSGHPFDGKTLVITVAAPDSSEVVGGLWGSTSYGWLHVDMLIVPATLRRQGLGTQLMRMAEEEALRRGCIGSYLDTFDFQARGFYERLGYTLFGALDGMPPGHQRFFLSRKFA